MEVLWKMRALGGRNMCVPPFKTLTLNTEMLHPEDSMRDGYHPKMLLYVLDELFYIFSQVKSLQLVDKKVIHAYEILCISANRCTDRQNGVKKTSMPDTLALLNMNDSSASRGWSMMAHCWWACGPNFQAIALGAWCWPGYISISTGVVMRWPIACHRH